jgi:hypothetical protein
LCSDRPFTARATFHQMSSSVGRDLAWAICAAVDCCLEHAPTKTKT